jgi:membrane protein DedA with SNARE-associated domain
MEEFVESGSYVAVILALLGGALGLPFPEEVVLLTSGALAKKGVTRWWLGLLVCYSGVLLADTALYLAARKLGNAALSTRRFGALLPPARRAKLRRLFETRGPMVILFARHVPGVRAATFALAGIDGFPLRRFLFWDGLGILSSVTIVLSLGHAFAGELARVRDRVADVQGLLLAGLGILLLALAVRALRRSLDRAARPAWAGSFELRPHVADPHPHEGRRHRSHERAEDRADRSEEGEAAEDREEHQERME